MTNKKPFALASILGIGAGAAVLGAVFGASALTADEPAPAGISIVEPAPTAAAAANAPMLVSADRAPQHPFPFPFCDDDWDDDDWDDDDWDDWDDCFDDWDDDDWDDDWDDD